MFSFLFSLPIEELIYRLFLSSCLTSSSLLMVFIAQVGESHSVPV